MFTDTTPILIVDDMSAMRQALKNQLRGMGFKNFHEADNGETAFQILNTQLAAKTPIQLILSDWNMPGGNGLDFLKKVRATPSLKDLPFILVTAEGEQRQVVEAIKAGVSSYLVKPSTPAAIQEKILAVWRK